MVKAVLHKVQEKVEKETEKQVADANAKGTGVKKDLLSSDPQLSAAVLLLRLQLTGTQL